MAQYIDLEPGLHTINPTINLRSGNTRPASDNGHLYRQDAYYSNTIPRFTTYPPNQKNIEPNHLPPIQQKPLGLKKTSVSLRYGPMVRTATTNGQTKELRAIRSKVLTSKFNIQRPFQPSADHLPQNTGFNDIISDRVMARNSLDSAALQGRNRSGAEEDGEHVEIASAAPPISATRVITGSSVSPAGLQPEEPVQPDQASENSGSTLTDDSTGTIKLIDLPNQLYLFFMFGIPMIYFSRVARIYDEADLTLSEIKGLVCEVGAFKKDYYGLHRSLNDSKLPPAYKVLKDSWEALVDTLIEEWKTLNIVSALLLGAIVTLLQIEGVAKDPFIKHSALFSLICALISLLYGCIFVIRFSSIKRPYIAAEWALEAKKLSSIYWNIWILLALPAVWLTWSILIYVACIISYACRIIPPSQDNGTTTQLSSSWWTFVIFSRVAICFAFLHAAIYGLMVILVFRDWGHKTETSWEGRINEYAKEATSSLTTGTDTVNEDCQTNAPVLQVQQPTPNPDNENSAFNKRTGSDSVSVSSALSTRVLDVPHSQSPSHFAQTFSNPSQIRPGAAGSEELPRTSIPPTEDDFELNPISHAPIHTTRRVTLMLNQE